MDPADLEQVTDRALRALPTPRAPRTLLPRVLAAIAAEAGRPWYARAWLTWPTHWQLVSGLAALAIVAAATLAGPFASAALLAFGLDVSLPLSASLAQSVESLRAAWDAARIVWGVVEPIARGLALLLLIMSAACVAFGTALDRVVALGGASES
jgi:hypothetical protein